ncbi:MAG: hypothetical protein ACF8LL_14000, partial [Phycisphaerales bacterium]
SLYWRSRATNDANKWYLSRADGMHRSDEWLVFWYGLDSRNQIDACIDNALALGHSFGQPLSKSETTIEHKHSQEPAHAG